ncbi:HIT family protein [Nonomuraea sp. M3C6]|uniref:HIT family protein n=1 Tax=Nonomuraea marmarensis TaxID=3351344 RepID=A0ABW7AUD5_9ACTN
MHKASCDFCTIVSNPEAEIVYEDTYTVGFFPLYPAVTGHTLLIPKSHMPDLFSLDEPTVEALARSTLKVAAALKEALAPEGMNVISSSGRAASQTVFHFHTHLVPRWANDRIGDIWPPKREFDAIMAKNLAMLIRNVIAVREMHT